MMRTFLDGLRVRLRDSWRGYTDADVESLRQRSIGLGFRPPSCRLWLTPGETAALGQVDFYTLRGPLVTVAVRHGRALVQMAPAIRDQQRVDA